MKTSLELLNEYSAKCVKIKEKKIMRPIVDGYYYVSKLVKLEFHENWTNWTVCAEWIPLDHSPENENFFPVKLDLGGLFGSFSEGPKEVNPEMLTGAVIRVSKVTVFNYEYEGEIKSSLGAQWSIEEFGISSKIRIPAPPIGGGNVNQKLEDDVLGDTSKTPIKPQLNIGEKQGTSENEVQKQACNPPFLQTEYDAHQNVEDVELIRKVLNSKPNFD